MTNYTTITFTCNCPILVLNKVYYYYYYYIKRILNHPANILSELPQTFSMRISIVLSDNEFHSKSAKACITALENADYMEKLKLLRRILM